ncbi:hypothetical protein B0T26DRAFT_730382 [Lasiosphaeria miniovina]|uniref:Uncharacterized protein n=1 Tax=Lasiosphaeria miniovina TaxID=1954250 RepID=A0AA39ZT81_9PEZI|nr:uncharacterized protein B0T26DRAFT_730382 [Lasiosphaeria miniovina]KAK0703232.1 hypothetical protein B0T26DRAFT_730382 [Lasiosphaeria miniovina]
MHLVKHTLVYVLDYPQTESRGEEDCRKLKKTHSASDGSWLASTTPSSGIRSAYRIADPGRREASNAINLDLV